MSELQELREEIDRVDNQLVRLFEERMDVVRRIGAYKAAQGIPIYDPEREQHKISEMRSRVMNPDNADGIAVLFQTLMDISKTKENETPDHHAH